MNNLEKTHFVKQLMQDATHHVAMGDRDEAEQLLGDAYVFFLEYVADLAPINIIYAKRMANYILDPSVHAQLYVDVNDEPA